MKELMKTKRGLSRRAAIMCSVAALAAGLGTSAQADPSGNLTILNWLGGGEQEAINALEAGFMAKYPGVTVSEVPVTWAGDARGGIRATLLGGETVDLVINTWPAFRQELADAGLTRSLDDSWDANGWGDSLNDSWRALGSADGVSYAIPFAYGGRSGLWYRPDVLEAAGLANPPASWDEMLSGFAALKANGVTPMDIPAKAWAQGETFETLYLRINGTEMAAKLVAHEIPWTDDSVTATLTKWREMLEAGCCSDVNVMLGTEWDNAADNTLKNGTTGYFMMGMWVNGRAMNDYGLTPIEDYSLFQFPALGLGHDDTSIVDAKEFVALSVGDNPEAADAFLGYVMSAEGANIIAEYGMASPSGNVDTSLFDPVTQASIQAVSSSQVHFVMGDMLPGDLADEYRVQLQKFLQDSSDASIDAVTTAIEAKAQSVY